MYHTATFFQPRYFYEDSRQSQSIISLSVHRFKVLDFLKSKAQNQYIKPELCIIGALIIFIIVDSISVFLFITRGKKGTRNTWKREEKGEK